MEKYNANMTCPKCGCADVSSKLVTVGLTGVTLGDFIKRNCGRCGFTCNQLPLDAGKTLLPITQS